MIISNAMKQTFELSPMAEKNLNPPWRGKLGPVRRELARNKAANAMRRLGLDIHQPFPVDPLVTASEGLRRVTVLRPRKVNVLDLLKHHTVIVSLESLGEMQRIFRNKRAVGYVAPRTEPPEARRALIVRLPGTPLQQEASDGAEAAASTA